MLTDDAGDQGSSAEAFHVLTLIVNGRLKRRLTTVVDATNLGAANRRKYSALAARYGLPTVAIAFDLPLETYHDRNSSRPDRYVNAQVVDDQLARMPDTIAALGEEGYAALHIVQSSDIDVTRS
jgi:protein phosphatase